MTIPEFIERFREKVERVNEVWTLGSSGALRTQEGRKCPIQFLRGAIQPYMMIPSLNLDPQDLCSIMFAADSRILPSHLLAIRSQLLEAVKINEVPHEP